MLLPWNCEFWFEITVNKIRSNFQTFISFTLYLEKTLKLNLLGKKKLFKTFVPYFISFSVIYSFYGFFESRARRTIFQNVFFQNVSLFPYISMFTVHFVAYLPSSLKLPRRGRTVHDHQGRQSASSSFSSFLFLTGKGDGSLTPGKNLANFSPIPIFIICTWNYFASIGKTLSLKCFQIPPANIKSVTSKQAVLCSSKLTSWPMRACEPSQLSRNHHEL